MLFSGVPRESSLWRVPEDDPLDEAEIGHTCLSSAFSVPQVTIAGDFSPIHIVSPSSSQMNTSLHDIIRRMQEEDDSQSCDSSTSLETRCSEDVSEERVRGGSLGELLKLQEQTSPSFSLKNTPKLSTFSQNVGTSQDSRHFLFESNPLLPTGKTLAEGKQHGSNKALDHLVETQSNRKPKDSANWKTAKSNRYLLGLPGTNIVSGVVGSLMYMAPEVYEGKQYDEKVDVFGFGVVMYELFLSELTILKVLMGAEKPSEMQNMLKKHAKSVAKGYRESIPEYWPQPIQLLICDCWHQNPEKRPRMVEVIERLKRVKEQGCIKELDSRIQSLEKPFGCCSCCILA